MRVFVSVDLGVGRCVCAEAVSADGIKFVIDDVSDMGSSGC